MEIIDKNHVDGPCQYSSLPVLPGMQQQVTQQDDDPKAQLLPPGFLQR